MQAFVVGRRFFGHPPLSLGDELSFREHTDERGYASLAAFLVDGACAVLCTLCSPASNPIRRF